jgi:hypothetical protein
MGSADACAVEPPTTGRRYFLRVLLPFTVVGHEFPYSWGVWEVSEEDTAATTTSGTILMGVDPAFPGRLETAPLLPPTPRSPGLVSRTDPARAAFPLRSGSGPPASSALPSHLGGDSWILRSIIPKRSGRSTNNNAMQLTKGGWMRVEASSSAGHREPGQGRGLAADRSGADTVGVDESTGRVPAGHVGDPGSRPLSRCRGGVPVRRTRP